MIMALFLCAYSSCTCVYVGLVWFHSAFLFTFLSQNCTGIYPRE